MAFKRKRVYAPRSNAFKKRKSVRRKTNRRGGKAIADFTSLNTKGTTVGFRGKKTSRKTYLRHLWNSTLFSSHYRSLYCTSGTVTTPANNTDYGLFGINLYRNGPATQFWTVAGGALPIDIGGTVPLFKSDITLRGGVWSVVFHNPGPGDIMLTIWKVFTVTDPLLSSFPAAAVKGWDPTVSGDFSTLIGKAGFNKSVSIEGGNSYTLTGRFKIQKIDQARYELEGKAPWLFCGIANVGTSAIVNVNFTKSHNLSFSGDAIGTT